MKTPPIKIPTAHIVRIQAKLALLAEAEGGDAILAALFRLHCECKDCLKLIPEKT